MSRRSLALVISAMALSACATPKTELEQVAKDWAMTIRASQVIPIYPLNNDTQPGDVFVVQTPISKQAEIYDQKGFLPTQQHVVRLENLGYDKFYQNGFWKNPFGNVPHDPPSKTGGVVAAPRAAFPNYSFNIDSNAGFNMALPVQGIPFGLGLMQAKKATASVTLDNAYTYGTDGALVYEKLVDWYNSSCDIRNTFRAMASETEGEVYLRALTRVYLVTAISVSLSNIEATSVGADAGLAKSTPKLDLSDVKPEDLDKTITAYQKALDVLSAPLNTSTPGGSVRLTQATNLHVGMNQSFAEPLVIGFLGFDVRVNPNGSLSAPIPSYTVLAGEVMTDSFEAIPFQPDDGTSKRYLNWLKQGTNWQKTADFLKASRIDLDPADLAYNGEEICLLKELDKKFGFPDNK